MQPTTPFIDPRNFQDIVDEAKRRIAQYTPEWTDHNVSDPGITLIELFAWMTDLIRYRLNNVPERDYRQFLKLIGARPRAAVPARTELLFWLSTAQHEDKTIPQGSEVAVHQTGPYPPVTFTTDADLRIRVPDLRYCVQSWRQPDGAGTPFVYRDVSDALGRANARLAVFQEVPRPDDALYLGFAENMGGHVLRLHLRCATARGFNVIQDDPPLVWEFWDGAAWTSLQLDPTELALLPLTDSERSRLGPRLDSTGGLNETGTVLLVLPRTCTMRTLTVGDRIIEACWVRCRASRRDRAQPFYDRSPELQGIRAESIGGLVPASHAFTVTDEELGRSTGEPGQVFMLRHAPVLPRRTDGALPEGLEVERPDGTFERWTEVAHFGDSGPADAHYMLDDLTGEVRFGPVLRDITGQERQHGRVPPKGRLIRFARYRSGGGSEGNVGRGTLVVPKSSANLDYVQRVTNLRPAYGGRDGETLEELMLRGPSLVRTRDVAVTRADYEDLVLDQFPQVAQVRCLPGASDPRANGSGASYVRLLLVPAAPAGDGPLVHEQLLAALDDRELCRQVRGWLAERCPLTTELAVGWADFQWVSVAARLVMRPQPDLAPFELEAVQARIREEARRRLYRFIHPSAGGPERKGWPFGRSLTLGDIYSLLEGMPDVRWVAGARLRRVSYDKTGRVLGPDVSVLDLPESAVLCSDVHEIEIVVE